MFYSETDSFIVAKSLWIVTRGFQGYFIILIYVDAFITCMFEEEREYNNSSRCDLHFFLIHSFFTLFMTYEDDLYGHRCSREGFL